jgi:serine/threonine protein kinase
VQIYKIDDFDQCQELEEAVHNEIHILRSIKHQSLLELKRVYENPKYLFIVYEFYKGESLFKLFNSGLQLHEVQIASIIY